MHSNLTGERILITGGSGFIGTHIISTLLKEPQFEGAKLLSVDLKQPEEQNHTKYTSIGDVRLEEFLKTFSEFDPTYVIHLAAETDVSSDRIDDYTTNIQGVENLIQAVNSSKSIKKTLFFSTQYVYQGYKEWAGYDKYQPLTVYGESKKIGEDLVFERCEKEFLILRPTNIWGIGNKVYVNNLFNIISKGLYFHPKTSSPVIRSYGYIENLVDQTLTLMLSDKAGRVYYLSDRPFDLFEFVNKLNIEITGKSIKSFPKFVFSILAIIGDFLKNNFGMRFPMNSTRLKNMVVSNPIPIEDTFEVTGEPKVDLNEAVKRTVAWYKGLNTDSNTVHLMIFKRS